MTLDKIEQASSPESTDRRPTRLVPATAEVAYDRLVGYRFAQRYVGGKAVADLSVGDLGYGTRILAASAGSVVGLTGSDELLELAQTFHAAPNVDYGKADFPVLPYGEETFDVVVALQVIETQAYPENLLRAAKRVLKRDGLLVVSTVDKQAYSNERNRKDPEHKREMYVPEFRGMLEKHFGQVRLYHQGTVAGGYVSPVDEASGAGVESAPSSATVPSFDSKLPTPHLVVAVCGDGEVPEEHGRSHVLLDSDRRVFEECDDYREDAELLRDEIQHMQRTEVQAFQDEARLRNSELVYLRAQLERSRARLQRLEKYIDNIENSRSWQALGVYRRLRAGTNNPRRPL